MFEFAQTNIQLFGQMAGQSYTLVEREQAATVYRFLMPMFSGLYRGTEKPFISHLIGTASILVAQKESIEIVLAGMLHAVYMAGDFGFQRGSRRTRRKIHVIENLAGVKVEEIVSCYDSIRWNPENVRHYRLNLDGVSLLERSALKLQLANTLEDLLDHGMNFSTGEKANLIASSEMQEDILYLGTRLAGCEFGDRLASALEEFKSGKTAVNAGYFKGRSSLILPPSARMKMIQRVWGWIVRRLVTRNEKS